MCRIKSILLDAVPLLPLRVAVVLQMLHVAIGLLSLSNLHTADILSTGQHYMHICVLPQIVL